MRPSMLERRALTPSQVVCARLLGELADPDLPTVRIAQLVGSDPGLTLRVLRTANSAATGTHEELSSLRQALVLLGPRRLRAWVVLALLDGGTSREVYDDLWSVLARAHACQRLAAEQADLGFTVGLLSGAAQLLGAEAADVADGAGLGATAARPCWRRRARRPCAAGRARPRARRRRGAQPAPVSPRSPCRTPTWSRCATHCRSSTSSRATDPHQR